MRYKTYTARTTPCSDDDFAELPHPFYYWYDWWPTRAGVEDEGKAYGCTTLMKEGVNFTQHVMDLQRIAAPSADYSDWTRALQQDRGVLRGTLLFGVQAGPAGRAFVYSGMEYTRGDRGALSLIGLMDQVAAGTPSPTLRWMYPDDFLRVKAYRPR